MRKTISGTSITCKVTGCSSCGKDHDQMEFSKLEEAFEDSCGNRYTMMGPCPETKVEVFLTYEKDK